MEGNILECVAEAESRAAEIKAQAVEQAAKIIAEAEKKASDIIRSSDSECASFREKALIEAQAKADAEYEKTINKCRAEAESYAESVLKGAPVHVKDIVGRLTK